MSQPSSLPNLIAGIGIAAALATTTRLATADAPPSTSPSPPLHADLANMPVDVNIPGAPPPQRIVTAEFNPLPLIIGKISANVVITPGNHHALTINPFYISSTTAPIWVFNDSGPSAVLPLQKFTGFGGELGYRYYTGLAGPRGFFAGASLILAEMTAKAQNGTSTGYEDFGVALDVGYELLVAERVALTLGAGAQYTFPDKSIPDQQFPTDFYANARLAPRALAAIGWAF
jgi:hypothetical protein